MRHPKKPTRRLSPQTHPFAAVAEHAESAVQTTARIIRAIYAFANDGRQQLTQREAGLGVLAAVAEDRIKLAAVADTVLDAAMHPAIGADIRDATEMLRLLGAGRISLPVNTDEMCLPRIIVVVEAGFESFDRIARRLRSVSRWGINPGAK